MQALHLAKGQLESLASANALTCFSGHRYQARWQLLDNHQDLPLLREIHETHPEQLPAPVALNALTEDYASLNLSLEHHPIALLRHAGLLKGCISTRQMAHKPHQSLVTAAGLVTGRQRPGTASGVTFITLEDETGNTNLVVWQGTARAQRQAYLNAKILKVKGRPRYGHLLAFLKATCDTDELTLPIRIKFTRRSLLMGRSFDRNLLAERKFSIVIEATVKGIINLH